MNDSSDFRSLHASKGHRLLTLIGFSFLLFEIIFVYLYSDKFWFSLDIRWLGIPTVLLVAAISHFILKALQSNFACRAFYWLWKGKPPVPYTRWVDVDANGFKYGIRRIEFAAIDELFLTFFGNLELRSDAYDGPVFKFPFAIASQEDQRSFMEYAKKAKQNIRVGSHLEKRLASPIVRGQNAVQFGGAAFMAIILLDVAFSSFSYLEMLKRYHLAQTERSRQHLAEADQIFDHPIPFSYVTNQFAHVKNSGAGVKEARANANLALGDLSAALADVQKAREMYPASLRLGLLEVRTLVQMGKTAEAKLALDKIIEDRQSAFVPRLYSIALAESEGAAPTETAYKKTMSDLGESTFFDEPRWPPGGNLYVRDPFYSDDIRFIFDRLLKSGS
jgi:tetratricopeptide (TPR) repeat protein